MTRKSILFTIVLSALISIIPISAYAEAASGLNNFEATKLYPKGYFNDVAESQWYYESVKSAYEYGLIMGNGNGKFNVSGNITIAETLALASRLNDIYYGGDGVFEQSGIWYQVYVNYAIENGIISYGEYSNYNASATRAQFVQILSKAFPDEAYSKINYIDSIPDVNYRDSFYGSAMKLYQAGILTGSDKYGTFNPKSYIVRTEVAAIITRMADQSLRKKVTLVQKGPEMAIHFIDVGQGDSTFIDFGNTEILIDAGTSAYGGMVSSYIANYVDGDIEYVIGTHMDSDHIGGMPAVLDRYRCQTIMDSGERDKSTTAAANFINAAINEGTTYVGDYDVTYNLGYGATLRIIETGDDYSNSNDNSVVCLLRYNDFSAIFTGDMSSSAEISNLSKFSDVNVLKAGHHGSNTSSSQAFLNVTRPEVAVISAAKGNSYGHPHIETLQRLFGIGASVYGTFKSGSIVVTTDGTAYSINAGSKVTTADAGLTTSAYIGNKNSKIFHYSTCTYVSKMSEANKVRIPNRSAAISAEYVPCKVCNP